MAALERFLIKMISHIMVGCLATMMLMVFANVILRYVFNSGITFSEELSRIMFVWLIFLGSIVAMKDHAHLGVDSLVKNLPPLGQKICSLITSVLMLFVCFLLFKGSWAQSVIGWQTSAPVTGLPMTVLYSTGMVASVGISAYLLLNIYVVVTGRATEKDLIQVTSENESEVIDLALETAEKKEKS